MASETAMRLSMKSELHLLCVRIYATGGFYSSHEPWLLTPVDHRFSMHVFLLLEDVLCMAYFYSPYDQT